MAESLSCLAASAIASACCRSFCTQPQLKDCTIYLTHLCSLNRHEFSMEVHLLIIPECSMLLRSMPKVAHSSIQDMDECEDN